jgi:methionyl-tRNA formyltransferase
MLTKETGRMSFAAAARAVHDHVRGMQPWPGAFTLARGKTVKVLTTRVCDVPLAASGPKAPGTVVFADKSRVVVACGDRGIELVRIQLEGKRPITAGDWFLGRGVVEGDVLGSAPSAKT